MMFSVPLLSMSLQAMPFVATSILGALVEAGGENDHSTRRECGIECEGAGGSASRQSEVCVADVDVRSPQIKLHQGYSEQQCRERCNKHVECAVFVHNWLSECHLRSKPWSNAPVLPDLRHGTVSCISQSRIAPTDFEHLQNNLEVALASLQARDLHEAPPVLFCWMLVRLESRSERDLARLHMSQRSRSLAACQHSLLLSNRSELLADGVVVRHAVHGSLTARAGGSWSSSLNTHIFMQSWRAVAADMRSKSADWVVKVDPDTVFFAAQLQYLLAPLSANRRLWEARGGTYLHNAIAPWGPGGSPMTVHWGPLEVFSTAAFTQLASVPLACTRRMEREEREGRLGGEDWWADTCMDELRVRHIYVDRLLSTTSACSDSTRRAAESSGPSFAAFHPFKSPHRWTRCSRESQAHLRWPRTSSHSHSRTPAHG